MVSLSCLPVEVLATRRLPFLATLLKVRLKRTQLAILPVALLAPLLHVDLVLRLPTPVSPSLVRTDRLPPMALPLAPLVPRKAVLLLPVALPPPTLAPPKLLLLFDRPRPRTRTALRPRPAFPLPPRLLTIPLSLLSKSQRQRLWRRNRFLVRPSM